MIQFFFGDTHDSFNVSEQSVHKISEFFKDPQLAFVGLRMNLSHLVILKQVHGNDGVIIESKNDLQDILIRSIEGDFLITNQKGVGLGLLTADCLPLIFYDSRNQIIAAVHAGWKGSVLGISKKVVTHLIKNFHTDVRFLKVFFGPAARVCCYEVSEQFYNNALHDTLFQKSIIKRNDRFYFDNGVYNAGQLFECGILKDAISYEQYVCTLCSEKFCSYRKEQSAQTRNVTVVSLK